MNYLNMSEYSASIYPPPSDNLTDAQKKQQSWYLQWAKHIFADYVQNNTIIGIDKQEKFAMLRAYGNGTQPEMDAMKLVYPQLNEEGVDIEKVRKGLHNIDSSILPIMVKFKTTIMGLFQDVDYTMFATATDKFSVDEKENKKWQLYADKELKDLIDEIDVKTNTPSPDKDKWLPKDIGELNLYESLGGFRIAAEIGIEKAIEVVMDKDSKIHEIKDKWIEDAIDVGYMAGLTQTDPETQKVYVKYVKPEYAITRYSREDSFDGQKFGGLIQSVSMEEIRKSGAFSKEQLMDIAGQIEIYNTGSYKRTVPVTDFDETGQTWGYDNYKVDILMGWVVSYGREYRKKVVSKKGRVISDEKIDAPTGAKGEYHVDPQVLYRFKWIIGTDYIYSEGRENDVVYDAENRPRIPLQIVKLTGKPITERCIPNIRNIQVGWIKYQNALTKARPPGLAVNYDSVGNMTIKGEKVSGLDLLTMTLNDGNIVYRGTNKMGNANLPGGRPVIELAGGMGNQLAEAQAVFEINRNFMIETTGVTPQSYGGGDVPERQSAMLSELMYNSTNNNLKPILKKYHDLKLRLAEDVVVRVQNGIRFSKKARDYYSSCIGKTYVESLKIPGGKSFREIGISLKLKPDQASKDRVLQAALEAMKVGASGQPGLSYSDYILVEMLLEHGNLKEAQTRLDIQIKEAENRAAKQSEAVQQQIAEREQQMKAMTIEEAKMKFEQERMLQQEKLQQEAATKIELKRMELELIEKKLMLAQLQSQSKE